MPIRSALLAFTLGLSALALDPAASAAQDTTPPRIIGITPAPGTTVPAPPSAVIVGFDEAIDPATLFAGNVVLVRSGGDGSFGEGNEATVVPVSVVLSGASSLTIDLTGLPIPDDTYRVTIFSHTAESALSFDGSDDVVACPPWLTGSGNTFTLECWARPLGSGASDGNLVIHRAHFNDSYLAWAVATGTFEFSISLNEKATSLSQVFSFGTWVHVAGTYDGTTVRLYIDGTEVGTHAVSKTIDWDTGYFGSFIGGNGVDPYNKFNGWIDEVRVWNVARSQSEIRDSMYRPLTGAEPGLVGYYRLDDGAGQSVLDQTPAARHGVRGLSAGAETADPAWVASTAPVLSLTDLAGNALDGESSGSFPTGNGGAGGDFSSTFRIITPSPSASGFTAANLVDGRCGGTGMEGFALLGSLSLLRALRRRLCRRS